MQTCWLWAQITRGYSSLITVIALILQNHANVAFDADAMNAIVSPRHQPRGGGPAYLIYWLQASTDQQFIHYGGKEDDWLLSWPARTSVQTI